MDSGHVGSTSGLRVDALCGHSWEWGQLSRLLQPWLPGVNEALSPSPAGQAAEG